MLKKDRVLLQGKSCNQILIFKVGPYFKIYNEGLFLLKDRKYKINLEYVNLRGTLVLSSTLTGNIFEELQNEFIIEQSNGYYVLHFSNKEIIYHWSAYLHWRMEQLEKLDRKELRYSE